MTLVAEALEVRHRVEQLLVAVVILDVIGYRRGFSVAGSAYWIAAQDC
jgi:hypothetical protein